LREAKLYRYADAHIFVVNLGGLSPRAARSLRRN
jgi:hypothetical protein